MAVVKCKPTSPGRRHVVKVVNPELHKGKPFAPLLEKTTNPVVVTTMAVSPPVISVVATSRLTVLLTSNATKMVSRQLLNVLSTIEPLREHRAGSVQRRRAPLHPRPERPESWRPDSVWR